MELRDLPAKGDVKGGAKKSVIKTPLPIRKANTALADRILADKKLPHRPFPWRRLFVISMAGFVIGNAICTLILYAVKRPELSAWTGTVPQSTPSAVNDLLLGAINLMLALYLLRKIP